MSPKQYKICSKCKKTLPVSMFVRNSTTKDGLNLWCKDCTKEYQQSSRGKIAIRAGVRRYQKTINGRLSNCFYAFRQRCNNPKISNYKNYGGRGIQCKFKNSQDFIDYVVNELQVDPRGLQIDRIDNDGHYEKGNIRFVTSKVNNNNKRDYK